jgi:hypothetical protein
MKPRRRCVHRDTETVPQERPDELALNARDFLWPEEVKLLHHILKIDELGLAWQEVE